MAFQVLRGSEEKEKKKAARIKQLEEQFADKPIFADEEEQFADKPIAQPAYDHLNFSRLVNFLANLISSEEKTQTVKTIGIYGDWGSGKTSFLKLLDERLKTEKRIYPIWFYAWRYDKQDDLWAALLQSVLNQAGKLKGQSLPRKWWIKFRIWFRYVNLGAGTWELTWKFFLGGLRIFVILTILFIIFYISSSVGGPSIAAFLQKIPFLKTVSPALLIGIANAFLVFLAAATADVGKIRDLLVGDIHVDLTKFQRKSNFRDRIPVLDEFNQELRDVIDLLRPPGKPLVVIIDDLDRCLPESALHVLESIKVFLDDSNCIFLLGLDKEVLEKAIKARYKEPYLAEHTTAQQGPDLQPPREFHLEYFDKIIPLAVVVPQPRQKQEDIALFIRELNGEIIDEDRQLEISDKKSIKTRIVYPDIKEFADIFSYTLSTNPRRIKRTLRSYLFVRDFVNARIQEQEALNKKRVARGIPEKDIPEKNIRFALLAKLIMIQSQFPVLYESIIRQPTLLEVLEADFRNYATLTPDKAAEADKYANRYQGLREILVRGKGNNTDTFVGQDIHFYIYQIGTLAEIGPPTPQQALLNEIFWNMPGRNELFVAREDILLRLHDTFAQQLDSHDARIVLSGSDGIGKTQIAIEYAYRYRQDYRAIFWVHAETHNMLIIDYSAIADFLELPEKNAQDQELVIRAVKTWFERQTSLLLILDGVGELGQVVDLLPHLSNGHILLTTHSQNADTTITTMTVAPLAKQESQLLLLRRAKKIGSNALLAEASSPDRDSATKLAQLLGGLPLALEEAGAYIEKTGCSVQKCLQLYQSSSDADHLEPVASIWSLSRQKIHEEDPGVAQAAEALLRLCALLDSNEIPIGLFRKNAALLGPMFKPIATFDTLLNVVLEELEKFALIRLNATRQTLSIPGLLLTSIRKEMGEHITRERVEHVILLVSSAFPEKVDISTWKECQRYLIPALACAHLVKQFDVDTLEAAQLLDRAGRYLRESGDSQAEDLLKRASAIYASRLGPEHPDTLATLNALALLYQAQGRYTTAEELMLRIQLVYEQKQEPLDIATSLSNLASLYNAQYRYTDAEPLLRRALAIRQQQLGEDHPDVATTKSELGLNYRAQARYAEAESLFQSALDIRQRVSKEDDPDVATSMSNLVDLYYIQEKYDEAEPLLQGALAIRRKALGEDHLDVATTLSNLAALYHDQDRYAEAEPLLQKALDIRQKALGKDHPDVATIYNNLAVLYYDQARYEEAKPLFEQALAILQKLRKEDDLELIAIQVSYASLLHYLKEGQKARELEEHLRQIQERSQLQQG